MFSDISNHTKNIITDPHCALIFDTTNGHTNPQEEARVGVIGKLKETNKKRLKA